MIDRPFRGRLAPEWVYVAIAILLLTAAVAAVTLSQSQQDRVLRGQNDFLILCSGATLVGSGDLYSPEAVKRVQQSNAGLWLRGVYYSRLPFHAALLKPLASFPYLSAYWIFQSINLGCFAVIVCLLFVRQHPACLPWLPLLISLMNGQHVIIVMMFCVLFLVLSGRGRDLAAAACLSVRLIKFHLLVSVPFAILDHRRWRIHLGGIGSSAFWVCVSFAVQGWRWPASYVRAGLALVAGIVLSVHAYTHDCALLLRSIPLLSGASGISACLRAALLTPVPHFGTLYGGRWTVILPLGLILFSAAAWHASWRKPAGAPLSDSSPNGDPCAAR